jgi:D-galactarolactone cycloisomerase
MKICSIEVFQVAWTPEERPAQRSAWVRVEGKDGLFGIGEASPMQGGLASLGIVARDLAPALIGADPLDHAVLQDRLLHRFAKLGPDGALTGALAALDIALWDLKGKLLQQPICKLIGGAWRTRARARGAGLLVVRGTGAALPCEGDGRSRAAARHHGVGR